MLSSYRNCKRSRNLAISLLWGYRYYDRLTPSTITFIFYRSLLPSMHSVHCLSEVWRSIFLNLTFLPLEMWYELFYHNFETFRTLVNEKTLITSFIHMITSCKHNSYGSTFSSLHFKTQHSLLLSILLQVTLAYHSYLLVHKPIEYL